MPLVEAVRSVRFPDPNESLPQCGRYAIKPLTVIG